MGNMTITLTLNEMLTLILVIVGVVALCFLIVALIKLSKVLKKADDILDDAKRVTEIVADRVEDVDDVVSDCTGYVSTMIKKAKENEGIIHAASSVAKAVANVSGLFKKNEDK